MTVKIDIDYFPQENKPVSPLNRRKLYSLSGTKWIFIDTPQLTQFQACRFKKEKKKKKCFDRRAGFFVSKKKAQ
jgi:hypothetical protein